MQKLPVSASEKLKNLADHTPMEVAVFHNSDACKEVIAGHLEELDRRKSLLVKQADKEKAKAAEKGGAKAKAKSKAADKKKPFQKVDREPCA